MGRNKGSVTGTLELTGQGRINVKPDIATVSLSVITEGKTAAEAVTKNADLANALVAALEALEISKDAMSTVGLNIYPTYSTDPKSNITAVSGYRAQDSLSVVVAVALAGKVFDAGIGAGANESSGLSFSVKDDKPHRQKALALAIKAARMEAETVSEALGITLVGPKTITINEGSGPLTVTASRMMKSDTPVMAGEAAITASVHIVFETET